MPLKSSKQIQKLKLQQKMIVANEEERVKRQEEAAEIFEALKKEAHDDLSAFAETVFDFDNGEHHHEWYKILMNKMKTPEDGDWDTDLEPAPENWVNERIGVMAPRNHAKSTCFTVVYPLWKIGNDPDVRILIVSNSSMQAQAFLREIKDKITKNKLYRQVFGDLFPADMKSPGEKWTDAEIIVRRKATHKDPTVSAMGAGGSILSKRADIIICDDILNLDNTRTVDQRAKIKQWYNEVLIPVLEPDGIMINVGTAWNLEDLLHDQLKNKNYDVRRRYKALLQSGQTLWPTRWPYEKLMQLKSEVGSVAFNKSYMNEAMSSEDSTFKPSWLERAKYFGRGRYMKYKLDYSQWDLGAMKVAIGVDLAISQKETADNTAFAVIGETKLGAKIPLWLEQGKFTFGQTQRKIIELANRYNPDIVVVENNGYQEALRRDLADNTSLPIVGYSTGGEKYDENVGVSSIAVEFENEKWILPYSDEEGTEYNKHQIDLLVEGMMNFGSGHTADILMALWFANGGLRRLNYGSGEEPEYGYGSKVDPFRR